MVKKQAEAMQLADLLEEFADEGRNWQLLDLSADELRRLYQENQELLHWMRYIQVQTHLEHIHDTASAAIAKVTGE